MMSMNFKFDNLAEFLYKLPTTDFLFMNDMTLKMLQVGQCKPEKT